MKRSIFMQLALIVVVSSLSELSNAQSVIGSWKKTSEELTDKNGKTKDSFQMLVKHMPCFASIVYTFSAGGKMDEQAKDCTIVLQKQVANEIKSSHWKMAGSKIIIDVSDKSSPVLHAEYHVEFVSPNEMIWTFDYSENTGVPNITKAKQMKTTYKRSAG